MRTEERLRASPMQPAGPARAGSSRRSRSTLVALVAWAGLIVVAHLWGRRLLDSGLDLKLGPEEGAPPIVGDVDLRLGWRVLPALVFAGVAVASGPRLARRLRWRHLVLACGLASAAWALALAFTDPGEWSAPLLNHGEYLHDVGRVGNPFTFLSGFTDRIADYQIHTEGHPPGLVLLFSGLDRVGFGGVSWAAALVIAAGAGAAPAVLVAARAVGGEAPARAAAPFLVLAPAAVWAATSADGLYMGVMAVGIALLALAGRAPARRADALALGAGIVLGWALFLTYGAVLMAPVALSVAWVQRRGRPLLVAAAGVAGVVAAFYLSGFWWVEGLLATRARYHDGVASVRPYSYFLIANLAAFALVVGPAVPVALTRLRGSWNRSAGPVLVVAGAVTAVLLADLSGLSKAEVERIWLPFAPWLVLATFTLTGSPPRWRSPRAWLGLQAVTAFALQVGVRSPW